MADNNNKKNKNSSTQLSLPVAKKKFIPQEKLNVFNLLPNDLYRIFLEPELKKDKMIFYWNSRLNPLDKPKHFKFLLSLTREDRGGEVFYLKNGSNVIFINYWHPFAIFYSLDKQKILFRRHLKSVYFHKV